MRKLITVITVEELAIFILNTRNNWKRTHSYVHS